jgi:PAS domain S-box-containing protein
MKTKGEHGSMKPVLKPARRPHPSLVAVVLGVPLTLGIFFTLWHLETQNARATFESVARERLDALETNVALTLDNLVSVKAFFQASPGFDRAGFARFVTPLLAQNHAIQALEWIPRVPENLRPGYESAARRDGFRAFQFTERDANGRMGPVGKREEYFPVYFVEPFASNEKALGFDLASNPARREALQRSAASGRMVATSRITLVQEVADQYGELAFYPLYAGEDEPHSEEGRRSALRGFALGVFRIQNMVDQRGTLGSGLFGLGIAVFDRDAKPGERLLYPKGARFESVEDLPRGFRTLRRVPVGGRTWEIVAYPLGSAFRPARWSSWAVLVTGLLLTLLLSGYLTEREASEEALQRSEERARLLFATIPTPVWVYDQATLGFLEVNQAALDHYQYGRDQFLKMKITDICPPEELDRLTQGGLPDRSVQRFPAGSKHRTRDGRTLQVECSNHALLYDGHQAVLVVAQDVTARAQLEMDLRHAQKLEAVGSLAAGIAHEINTPIQFIGDNIRFLMDSFADLASVLAKYHTLREAAAGGGAAQDVAQEVAEAERAADLDFIKAEIPKALAQALEGVTRVATIVQAMKEFAHPNPSEKAATDLNRALQSTLIVARNEIKYVADVETDLQEMPLVQCNGGDMNQVFLNLLVNAAHAIKDRGERNGHKGVIGIRTRCEGDQVVISISDSGCGIPENIREKIFEPFFTTKEVGRGTGQGLAIARSIVVDNHGGTLTFESVVGQGSTFHVRLPISLAPGS